MSKLTAILIGAALGAFVFLTGWLALLEIAFLARGGK